MGKNCVVFGITQNLTFAVANIIMSIEKKSPKLIDAYIIYYSSDSPIKVRERSIVSNISDKVQFRELDFNLDKNVGLEHFFQKYTELCFAKFKILDLVKDEFEKVLWLDADLLILQDISEIFNYEGFAWKPSYPKLQEAFCFSKFREFDEFDISEKNTKPNGGVILVTRNKYTDRVYCKQAIKLFDEIKNIPGRNGGMDEICFGLLAIKYGIQVNVLEPKWNFVLQNEKVENPIVVHCMGKNKIWKNSYLAMLYPEFLENNALWIELGGEDYTSYTNSVPVTKNQVFRRIMWEHYWCEKFMHSKIDLLNKQRICVGDMGNFYVKIYIPGIDRRVHYELIQSNKEFIYQENNREVIAVCLHIEKISLVDDVTEHFLQKIADDLCYSIDCKNGFLKIQRKTMNLDVINILKELIEATYAFLINHYY